MHIDQSSVTVALTTHVLLEITCLGLLFEIGSEKMCAEVLWITRHSWPKKQESCASQIEEIPCICISTIEY
jgi:hypothetical protein